MAQEKSPVTAPAGCCVRMVCADLANVPRHDVRAPFALRWYQPGDEAAWVEIHQRADHYNPADTSLFQQQFADAPEQLPKRQCYLLDEDSRPIGTATAWFGVDPEEGLLGRIHWVAIVPEHQGKGLAKPLMYAACRRLLELRQRRAYLTTSTARVPAVNLYHAFGFVPDIRCREDLTAWRSILRLDPEGTTVSPGLRAALSDAEGVWPPAYTAPVADG